jgi:hypothetical protein
MSDVALIDNFQFKFSRKKCQIFYAVVRFLAVL